MIKISYKYYLLALLLLAGVFTTFERFVFSLAMEPIKLELQLSDSQLGLMTGIAFSAFYAIAGIPIARWADRGNRVTILALAVGMSSVMVSLCGVAGGFIHLLLVRAGVAVGEAGIIPTGQSVISDYFDRSQRPHATAVFISFYSISMIVGYLVGGRLIEDYGWRATFIIMGLPGIVLALIIKNTLKEPRLNMSSVQASESYSLIETFKMLWRQPTFRQIFLAFCVSYFFIMGVSQWLPSFLIRSHGMTPMEVGTWLSFCFGIFGTLGSYLGGYCASRFAARQERLQMRIVACAFSFYGIANLVVYLSLNKYTALIFIAIGAVASFFVNGPILAAMQSLVVDKMRSVAVAITFLFANLIGFGLGPLALGVISDLLYPIFGHDSLRYALAIFTPGLLWVAYHYWQAGNTIEGDIRLIEEKTLRASGATSSLPNVISCDQSVGKPYNKLTIGH